ncbi:Uma2 family endonuclease [Myxococcus sp. K38C18041901]|uniref:Uma2 family endonuclease n=1 Tax=Myxococcus guangdongensis TaxID=2906760 RepID=UPI0020A7FBF7|nr:Uma2 family endonuclease [Myxococcus guangdongensis]MCP3059152.1 Uma2 family endonuclease [Myxococcus guangdongensis]
MMHAERMNESLIDKSLYKALEALPEHVVGEIIDGELHVSPSLPPVYGVVVFRLVVELGSFDDGFARRGPGGWVLLPKPELHLGPNVLVPDLAAWRRERMPELPMVVGMTTPPDWLCEVLSPSTASRDRGAKMNLYARAGVKHLWLLDPRQQQLEVYRLEAGRWTPCATHTGAVSIRAEPFAAQNMNLGSLFER